MGREGVNAVGKRLGRLTGHHGQSFLINFAANRVGRMASEHGQNVSKPSTD